MGSPVANAPQLHQKLAGRTRIACHKCGIDRHESDDFMESAASLCCMAVIFLQIAPETVTIQRALRACHSSRGSPA